MAVRCSMQGSLLECRSRRLLLSLQDGASRCLGFRVWGLGFGVWGLGFGVSGLGFRVSGLGFEV